MPPDRSVLTITTTTTSEGDPVYIDGLRATRRKKHSIQIWIGNQPAGSGEAVVEFDDAATRFGLTRIELHAQEHEHPLNGDVLRAISIPDLIRKAAPDWSDNYSDPRLPPGKDRSGPYGLLTDDARERLKALGPVDETLALVALIYRVAFAVSDPPTKQVEEAFGVSRPTADRWVRKARQAGFLGANATVGRASI